MAVKAIYPVNYMKKKLLEIFGDQIIIIEINGKSNILSAFLPPSKKDVCVL